MFRHKKIDPYLLLCVFFLLIISSVVISSVYQGNIVNHLIYIMVGILFFLVFYFIDLEILFPFSYILYILSTCFLILPILIGTATRGSVRWIPIGGYTIQPSEVVKPFFALMSAYFWSKTKFNNKNLFKYILFFLPSFILIFRQPDLGSSLVMLSIFVGMVLFSGISLKQILPLVLICALLLPLSWFVLKDYQRTRAIHFINPYSDPLGEGYNVIQSTIAVGSGGLVGKGFGKGTQSHLSFLPERHTDFIFASASEEFGFMGDLLILALYFIFLQRILTICRFAREKKHFLLCVGIFFYFFFQTVVNIGMNIGIMPITGITLPFLSYGGSSILVSMICLGLIQNVYRDSNPEKILIIK